MRKPLRSLGAGSAFGLIATVIPDCFHPNTVLAATNVELYSITHEHVLLCLSGFPKVHRWPLPSACPERLLRAFAPSACPERSPRALAPSARPERSPRALARRAWASSGCPADGLCARRRASS